MSTDQMGILEARLAEMEKRVLTLEAADEIRNLKAEYAAACDDDYDADRIAVLFAEDATWEAQGMGVHEGREAIRKFFQGISGHFTFAVHYSLNPKIEVDGNTARAKWYLFMPCTVGDTGKAMWRASVDEEEYVRIDGRWMFKSKKSAPFFHTPFEKGWAEQRFA